MKLRRRKNKEPDIRQIIREEFSSRENEKKLAEEESNKRLKREQFEKLPHRTKIRILKKMEDLNNDKKR